MAQDTKTMIHEGMLGDMFESDTFRAFIFDFHYAQDDSEMMNFGDIMGGIFGDDMMYRKFIKYCKDYDYAFLPPESRNNLKKSISLLAFEQARKKVMQTTLDALHEILDMTEKGLEKETSRSYIPGTTISLWQGLMVSLHKNIPTNNYGQVIYMIGKVDEIYEVYSHEAGRHFVNKTGVVTTLEHQNKAKRIILLQTIETYQKLLSQSSFDDDDSDIEELKAIFLQEKKCEWNQSLEIQLRFRSWIGEKLREMQHEFQKMVHTDHRYPKLTLVGGSYVMD